MIISASKKLFIHLIAIIGCELIYCTGKVASSPGHSQLFNVGLRVAWGRGPQATGKINGINYQPVSQNSKRNGPASVHFME